MEVKIENLIEKLKKEGVEGARKASDELLEKSKAEAAEIVEKAKKEADNIIADAKRKADSFEENGKLAIQQAARDGQLMLKSKITELFDIVFKREVSEAFSPEFMKDLIFRIIDQWGGNVQTEITVNESDLKDLEKLLFSSLKKDVQQGIVLKPSRDIAAGFRIGLKGENVYYDFSDDSIAEILKISFNSQLKEILDS